MVTNNQRTHIAIMKSSWGLTDKIISGKKVIETRWYKNRYRPWGKIEVGDIVYFKDSGGPVRVKTIVSKVEQYDNLNQAKRKMLLSKYSQSDLGTSEISKEILDYISGKRYCIVVHLAEVEKVEPFNIDKTGYGAMSAWLIVEDIEEIKQ